MTTIRKATYYDIPDIMTIYESARRFMRSRGNTVQWSNGYPSMETIQKDIDRNVCFVADSNGKLLFVFAFIVGYDPTYQKIDGEWLDDEPYGTIHRLASSGATTGVFHSCLKFCMKIIGNIRVDTHESNRPMRRVIEMEGFKRCGIIYVADGTPRIAYQRNTIHTI